MRYRKRTGPATEAAPSPTLPAINGGASMEREEPKMGAPDLSSVDFNRGASRIVPAPRRAHDLWWQVALGVFIAMMCHSMVIGIYQRWEMRQALKEMNRQMAAETDKLEQRAAAIHRAASHPKDTRPWPTSSRVPPAPLRDGERCIRGERFQRLDNGWKHLPHQRCAG